MNAATTRIPQATLREEWSATYVAWRGNFPPSAAPAPVTATTATRPERNGRVAEALLRLASDPRATAAERALAARKAADLLVSG
ncbi:MAG TPA: hypothetical protein VNS55_14870 [Nocardioides sp.]|nr:hypothetical protein [Nocardioides sp.]